MVEVNRINPSNRKPRAWWWLWVRRTTSFQMAWPCKWDCYIYYSPGNLYNNIYHPLKKIRHDGVDDDFKCSLFPVWWGYVIVSSEEVYQLLTSSGDVPSLQVSTTPRPNPGRLSGKSITMKGTSASPAGQRLGGLKG